MNVAQAPTRPSHIFVKLVLSQLSPTSGAYPKSAKARTHPYLHVCRFWQTWTPVRDLSLLAGRLVCSESRLCRSQCFRCYQLICFSGLSCTSSSQVSVCFDVSWPSSATFCCALHNRWSEWFCNLLSF